MNHSKPNFSLRVCAFCFASAFALLNLVCCTTEPVRVHTATPTQQLSAAFYSQKTVKRKVAIARFTTQSNPFFNDQYNEDNGKRAMDLLTSKLAQTGKFIILERSDLNLIANELNTSLMSAKSVQADYLITGSVTRLGKQSDKRVGGGRGTVIEAAVAIRVIDVHTGEVIYTEEGVGSTAADTKQNANLNALALDAALNNLATNLMNNMLERKWKGYIVSKQNGFYMITGGPNQGINQGDRFLIKLRGQVVTNPQTGMPVELPGMPIGEVTVAGFAGGEGNNEISWAQMSGGSMESVDATGDYNQVYIEEM